MNDLAITLDIDWAPDFVIDEVAGRFVRAGVRATWFVTHDSPAVRRLASHDGLFELGVHPNFMSGSTHGEKPADVLKHVMALVPGARSLRAHGLVQSTSLLDLVIGQTPLEVDVTMFLPRTPGLRPFAYHWRGRTFWRVPFFWEDDFEMERSQPCWEIEPYLEIGPGLKVFNFHPIHVYLNSPGMGPYLELKRTAPQLTHAERCEVEGLRSTARGVATLLDQILAHRVAQGGGGSMTISSLVERWRSQQRLAFGSAAL